MHTMQNIHSTHIVEAISDHVWRTQYRWLEGGHMQEPSIEATLDRVALAVANVETHHRDDWRARFRAILSDFRFLPGGRILAGAGTARQTTLFNCFVAGTLEDSIQGIFNGLREAMLTLQAGGGVGVDFSTLRPLGSPAIASAGNASGPVSFMAVWSRTTCVAAP
jgi:ribonucleoside-diphosphate reductase alpha chain